MSDATFCLYKCTCKTEKHRKASHRFTVPLMDTEAFTSISDGLFDRPGVGGFHLRTAHRHNVHLQKDVCPLSTSGRENWQEISIPDISSSRHLIKRPIWKLRMRNRILLKLPRPVAPWEACVCRGAHTVASCPLSRALLCPHHLAEHTLIFTATSRL